MPLKIREIFLSIYISALFLIPLTMKVLVERIELEAEGKSLAMMWRNLPSEHEIIRLNDKIYYFYEGAFYVKSSNGYRFTSAPLGAVVQNLPDNSEIIEMGGKTYFYYCGIYYQYQPETHTYIVIEKPVEINPTDNESPVTIDLIDGQKFQGDILDVTSDSIYFKCVDGLLELSISEVSTITFMPIPLEERRN
jgi:hypothetical protein